ncbi:MAG: SDR family oxidoreductase [Steroidobacteraceae bacterium]|nr:SDR family oxidoreductase [Steroidobacteraceae bacterium]
MSIGSEFSSQRILIVGGSSGMGLALAEKLLALSAEVTIVGRSTGKLAAAEARLAHRDRLRTLAADVTQEGDVARLFSSAGKWHHIVTTAADIAGVYELLPSMNIETARRVLDSKIIGPLLLAKYGAPRLEPGGSITFTSGIAAYRPAARGSVVAAVNGALQSLVYALAIELAPIRVNAVSPGWVDTPIWQHVAGERKADVLGEMARRLPVSRIGRPSDIADAITAVMANGFMTGTVMHVDGGQRLV